MRGRDRDRRPLAARRRRGSRRSSASASATRSPSHRPWSASTRASSPWSSPEPRHERRRARRAASPRGSSPERAAATTVGVRRSRSSRYSSFPRGRHVANDALGHVHRGHRHRRRGAARRRHRHDGHQGGAGGRQPGGRRDVRHRQHVPVASGRRRRVRPVRGRRASTPCPTSCARSCPRPRPRRSTSATSASTTTSPGSTSTGSTRRPTSRRSPTRRTATCSSCRTRRRRRPGLAFLHGHGRRVRRRRLARLLDRSARQRRRGRRRLGAGVLRALLRGERRRPSRWWSATARARRPRSCSPIRRSTTPTTAVIDTTCFRQVEFAGVLRGTDAEDEAQQLVDFLLSEPFQARAAAEPVRLPGERRRRPARRVHRQRHGAERSGHRSTRPRSPPTARPGSTSGPTPSCADPVECSRPSECCDAGGPAASTRPTTNDSTGSALGVVPVVFLGVFYVWPFVTLLARGLRPATVVETFDPVIDVGDRLVHAVAGRRQHRADDRRRTRPRLRPRPLLASPVAACCPASSSPPSCCRRS